jgi:hypothetical protein
VKTIDANKTSPKVYDPVWRCIYCGGNDREHLTKEHIIPIGLQDGFILPKSSCVPCQRITGGVENTVMRKALFPYRWHSGFVSHKQIPEMIPLGISLEQNPKPRHVALAEHPNFLLLPRLHREPSILSGVPQTPFPPAFALLSLDDNIDASMQRRSGKLTLMRHMFNFDAYWRMIAKIAHAFAVADIGLGLGGFIPRLPDLILGKDIRLASDLIGDWPEEKPPFDHAEGGPLHRIAWGFRPWNDQHLVMVYMRLFSGHGRTPTYAVVAGVATDAAIARHGLP